MLETMADNDTQESSPVVKQDNTNEIKTSSLCCILLVHVLLTGQQDFSDRF